MSIVSGLVGAGAEHSAATRQSGAGEWVIRNVWSVILTGSSVFWLTLAAVFFWR